MIVGKKILFLFLIFTSLAKGGNLFFSIDNGATNIKNNLLLYIYTDERIQNSDANSEKIKSAMTIQKQTTLDGEDIQEDVDFSIFIIDDNKTIEIQTVDLLGSGGKYIITILGSKIIDENNRPYNDNSISFTSKEFSKIILSDQNTSIKRGSSIKISATLDSFLESDIYKITSTSNNILFSPSQVSFNQINWDKPTIITITFLDGNKYINDTVDVVFTSTNSGFKKMLKVSLVDTISVIFDKKYTFTFTDFATAKLKLSKAPPKSENKVSIKLVSKNTNISISPSVVFFDYENWDKYQEVNISTNKKEEIQDFIYMSTVEQKKFEMKEANISINFINSDISSLPVSTISNIYTDSLYAYIVYSLPENIAYDIKYKIYATRDKLNYSEDNLLKETIKNKSMLILQPNQKYEISVIATYSTQVLSKTINKTFTYSPITITTNKIIFKDENNNNLLDGIERMLSEIYPSSYEIDSNSDNIPDSIQIYTASIFNSQDFSIYDEFKDSDGDKMSDLLEVAVGRNPNKIDFIPPSEPEILNTNLKKIYLQDAKHETIHKISKIRIIDGSKDITHKVKAYYSFPCLPAGIVPYSIFTTECKEIVLKDLQQEKEVLINWVVFDDDFNIGSKKQKVTLFRASKTISYTLSNFTNSIKSTDSNVLFALGKYSKDKNENNISLKLSDLPSTPREKNIHRYDNNIFDFKAFRLSGQGSDIIIPQIKAIKENGKVRVFKENKWGDFDTSGEDKVFTSAGRNKKCNIPHQYYTEGINKGHYCLKLRVKDGSRNDSDGFIDGIFTFTGGISTKNDFTVFETKASSGCSSLNAKGFNKTEQEKTKIDPLLPIILFLSFLFTIRAIIRKS